MIELISVLVALWVGYEVGRSTECAEWCARQLRKTDPTEPPGGAG